MARKRHCSWISVERGRIRLTLGGDENPSTSSLQTIRNPSFKSFIKRLPVPERCPPIHACSSPADLMPLLISVRPLSRDYKETPSHGNTDGRTQCQISLCRKLSLIDFLTPSLESDDTGHFSTSQSVLCFGKLDMQLLSVRLRCTAQADSGYGRPNFLHFIAVSSRFSTELQL